MTRLEERIRSGLQETAERIPDSVPTLATERITTKRPAGLWAAVAAAAAVLVLSIPILLLDGSDSDPNPAGDLSSPFAGTWVTNDPVDGTTATIVIHASEDGSIEMLMHDDVAFYQIVEDPLGWMCSGGAATTTGTGRLEAENKLVFPEPVATCDDQPVEGLPPLEEVLQNLTFTYDSGTDTLTDNLTDNSESVWTRADTELTEFLNGFVEARVAGAGAQQYLNGENREEDIPLLYATSSGAPYERGEFEQVRGIQWPRGRMAVKVRLFAGDTVVEQLIFWRPVGPLGLDYDPDGFGTHIAPTTEDGQPLAMTYNLFGGDVTMHVAHPWIGGGDFLRLIPEGTVAPTTDGGERIDWDEFWVMADPAIGGKGCQTASPGDVAVLVESIRSSPGLEATAPVTVNASGTEALMMDVVVAAGATIRVAVNEEYNPCPNELLNPILDQGVGSSMTVVSEGVMSGQATGERMRLYLFDIPNGSTIRTMAIAIVAPESRFERAVDAAAPVVDSVEFHTP